MRSATYDNLRHVCLFVFFVEGFWTFFEEIKRIETHATNKVKLQDRKLRSKSITLSSISSWISFPERGSPIEGLWRSDQNGQFSQSRSGCLKFLSFHISLPNWIHPTGRSKWVSLMVSLTAMELRLFKIWMAWHRYSPRSRQVAYSEIAFESLHIHHHPPTIGVKNLNPIVLSVAHLWWFHVWFLHLSTCCTMYFWRPVSVYP